MFVPIGSALAAGKAFDFRADILLLIGGALVLFCFFLAPMVLRMQLGRTVKSVLLSVAGVLILYGLILTILPKVWTPFAAKFGVPQIGWKGVFSIAIVFDFCGAALAWFVLRRMKPPVRMEEAAVAAQAGPSPARA